MANGCRLAHGECWVCRHLRSLSLPGLVRQQPILPKQSFPNSGTSYTLHTVRELTNTTTATNYGLEGDIKDEDSAPAFKGDIGVNGPYLELIPGRTTTIPELILTKTHCGGYSYSLNPDSYIVNPRKFLRECLFSLKGVRSNDTMARQPVWYSPDLVKKVVHIVRDPFDNVVARFHLDRYAKTESWLKEYPANKLGFQKWCIGIDDDNKRLMRHKFVDNDLRKAFSGVPCRAEFFRYVQWHNMVSSISAAIFYLCWLACNGQVYYPSLHSLGLYRDFGPRSS